MAQQLQELESSSLGLLTCQTRVILETLSNRPQAQGAHIKHVQDKFVSVFLGDICETSSWLLKKQLVLRE